MSINGCFAVRFIYICNIIAIAMSNGCFHELARVHIELPIESSVDDQTLRTRMKEACDRSAYLGAREALHSGVIEYIVADGKISEVSIFILKGGEAYAVAKRAYMCIESIVELVKRLSGAGIFKNEPITIIKTNYGLRPSPTLAMLANIVAVLIGILEFLSISDYISCISHEYFSEVLLAAVIILLILLLAIAGSCAYERVKTKYLLKFKYRTYFRSPGGGV